MKKFIPNEEAVIEAELRADDRERDLKWVRERLAQAEKKLDRAEQEWQNSGGYGSRSQMTRLENEVRLCRLALRGLETGCHRCDMRWKNISSLVDTLEAEKRAGFDKMDIDRAIDLIKAMY
jgi:hypothetical protein